MSKHLFKIVRDYQQLTVRYDASETSLWFYLNPRPRPCFTPTLLSEIRQFQQSLNENFAALQEEGIYPVNYVVLASQSPNVFNLGGDLKLFAEHIVEKNREQLLDYATACINVLYHNAINLSLPITTISLVEGSALGGGFEAALSSNILIAERSAELGLPEILFNLFPGMGAYSLLARRLGMVDAEKIITSGKVYRAAELYDMGVVDVLAEDGTGQLEIAKYIKQHSRSRNGLRAINAARQRFSPVSYGELLDIAKIWVDAALNLQRKDIRMMQRLVRAQDKRHHENTLRAGIPVLRSKQDRRIRAGQSFPLIDHHGNTIVEDRRRVHRRECAACQPLALSRSG